MLKNFFLILTVTPGKREREKLQKLRREQHNEVKRKKGQREQKEGWTEKGTDKIRWKEGRESGRKGKEKKWWIGNLTFSEKCSEVTRGMAEQITTLAVYHPTLPHCLSLSWLVSYEHYFG